MVEPRSIHPMPYVLRYDASTGAPNMRVSRANSDARVVQYGDSETNGAEKIRYYFSPFVSEFGLSAVESASQEGQIVVKEGLFGIHAEVRGPSGTQRKILFPIYSGMSYVSGFYTGFTPKITSDRALLVLERVSNGIWRLLNNGGKETWPMDIYRQTLTRSMIYLMRTDKIQQTPLFFQEYSKDQGFF